MSKKHNDVIHAALIQAAAVLTQTYFVNRPQRGEETILEKFQEMLQGAEQKFSAHIASEHDKK
ncbi:MAG: hypothetical protein LKI57_09600 [Acetobacter lovaniensis]|jgi:hypothetical protein|nr:hypothetical protein [Acetobacter lovaniensis]